MLKIKRSLPCLYIRRRACNRAERGTGLLGEQAAMGTYSKFSITYHLITDVR